MMRNISDESYRKNQNILCLIFFFLNRAIYQAMWKNIVKPGTPHLTIWLMRMRNVCWISRNTNTHLACVTIIAFPLQQWLHEHATLLR